MIAALLAASARAEFVSAVRALDRILLSGRYGIPLYYAPKQWIAAWSQLRQPPGSTLYGAELRDVVGGRCGASATAKSAIRWALRIARCSCLGSGPLPSGSFFAACYR